MFSAPLTSTQTLILPVGECVLQITDDRLQAYFSCLSPVAPATGQELVRLLNEAGIVQGIVPQGIEQACAAFSSKTPFKQILIAAGYGPRDGVNARIEFDRRPLGAPVQIDSDADKVDYREVNAVDNVRAGECIGRYIPKVEGVGGVDVFGKVILPQASKDIVVTLGSGVEFREETNEYLATEDGYVVFRQSQLMVVGVYYVKSDVTLRNGNIRFVGPVEIGRDVPDEFIIESGKSIVIGGTAEACQLKAATGIQINGGVKGKGKGKIEAGGRVQARFLNDTTLVAGGDVYIQKEIVNSRVLTLGRIIMPAGTVRGSELVALKGMLIGAAGSELGTVSTLTSGMDYGVYAQLRTVYRQQIQVHHKLQGFLNQLGPLLVKLTHANVPNQRDEEQAQTMMLEARSLKRQLTQLEEESAKLNQSFRDTSIEMVTILNSIQAGTKVWAGKAAMEFDDSRTGPISFSPSVNDRRLDLQNGALILKRWDEAGYPSLQKRPKNTDTGVATSSQPQQPPQSSQPMSSPNDQAGPQS